MMPTYFSTKNLSKILLSMTLAMSLNMATVGANAELIIQPVQTQPVATLVTPVTTPALPYPFSTVATAQAIPSDASIARLIQVLNVDDMIDGVINQQQQFATAMKQLPATLPMGEGKKTGIFSHKVEQQMQQIFSKYSKVFGQQIDAPKQREAMLLAYQTAAKKHYTQAEVNALIGFYDNPMGQQILQKQNLVTQDFMQVAVPSMMGNTDELQKALPTMQQDIEKIFK